MLQTRLAATSTEVAKPGGMKDFLMDKTGVTGFGTLLAGLTAVSFSKELIIIHSEVGTVGMSVRTYRRGFVVWFGYNLCLCR